MLGTYPREILHNGKRITKVRLSNGRVFDDPQALVSSVPINVFCGLLKPRVPKNVIDAVQSLRFRSQVYLFLTINKPSVSKDSWIYFPDKAVPFARFAEMKNFSEKMAPEGKTSLFIEFFCWEGDKVWNMGKEELLESSVPHLERLGFLKRDEILDSYHIKAANNYPVYDIGYEQRLQAVKEYLDTFENLLYIGRPGRFRYTNQDHSLEMGILAARTIMEGKKYDFDEVGAENEYFERGYLKNP